MTTNRHQGPARTRRNRVTIVDSKTQDTHFGACENASVYLTASLCMLVLSAVAYIISISSTNWSVSGQFMKMGIWDVCITLTDDQDVKWRCYPVNAGTLCLINHFAKNLTIAESTLLKNGQGIAEKQLKSVF